MTTTETKATEATTEKVPETWAEMLRAGDTWTEKRKEKLRRLEFDLTDTREALDGAHDALRYAVLIAEGKAGPLGARVVRAFEETVAARALLEDMIAGRVEEV